MENTKDGYDICYIGKNNYKEYFSGILKNFLAKKD
jgi:hypothetical protein